MRGASSERTFSRELSGVTLTLKRVEADLLCLASTQPLILASFEIAEIVSHLHGVVKGDVPYFDHGYMETSIFFPIHA